MGITKPADIYLRHKKVYNVSLQALIDNKINSLPVNVVKVTNNNDIRLLKNSDAQQLRAGERGISIFNGSKWFIVYDDMLPLGRKRFTVAHELGHIFLKHPLRAGYHTQKAEHNPPPCETEADIFAICFLCPPCILSKLNISTAAEVTKICGISCYIAKTKAADLINCYKCKKTSPGSLERKVVKQFTGFKTKNTALKIPFN